MGDLLFWIGICLLGLAAAAGLWAASHLLRRRLPPWRASIVHGALATAGLVLVLLRAERGFETPAGLLMLMLAVLTGMALLSLHLLRKPSHGMLIALHALLALAGLAALVLGAMGGG